MKKSIFKNTIYKALLSFVNIVIPLLVGPYIVKLLDVELYGIYNKVFADFQLFLTFASFGIYVYGVREISKIRDNKEKVSQLLSNLFIISIISNIAICLVYILYALFTSNGLTTNIYLLMIIQIVGNIFYIEFVNEALENYKFITIKTVIVKILYIVSLFLFVKKPTDIIIYTIIVCLTVFLNNIISFMYAKKEIKFNFKSIKIQKYLPSLLLVLIITNVDLLYSQLDKIMLGKFASNVSVTMYYIPYYIVSTLAAIPYSIINVSIPRLSYLRENEGKKNYEHTLNKSVSSLLFIIIPICLGVFVLAKEVVLLYAGDKYIAIIPILMLACIIRIIISVESTMVNLVMYPNNQEKVIVKYTLICGIVNLVLNSMLIFMKIINPFTVMFTTGICEITLSILLYRYLKAKLQIDYKLFTKQNIIYLVLGLLFIPTSLFVRALQLGFLINIVVIIIICASLYVGVLYFKKDDNLKLILDKVLSKVRSKKS